MELVTLFERFAFPAALAIYLLWQQREERKRCEERHDALQSRIDELCETRSHSIEGYPKLYRSEEP